MFDAINDRIFNGDSTQNLSKENFLAGFVSAVKKQALVAPDSAAVYVNAKAEAIKEKALETKYADYKNRTKTSWLLTRAKKE